MAINQNHLFEELDGIKCAVVEKNVSIGRVEFLKRILEYNRYAVVVIPTPAGKTAPPKAAASTSDGTFASPTVENETYTIGVTDVMFNPVNAIFGRLLKLPDGHIVTLAYWQQKEEHSHDEVPYYNVKQSERQP